MKVFFYFLLYGNWIGFSNLIKTGSTIQRSSGRLKKLETRAARWRLDLNSIQFIGLGGCVYSIRVDCRCRVPSSSSLTCLLLLLPIMIIMDNGRSRSRSTHRGWVELNSWKTLIIALYCAGVHVKVFQFGDVMRCGEVTREDQLFNYVARLLKSNANSNSINYQISIL